MVALAILATACGSSDPPEAVPDPTEPAPAEPEPTTPPEPTATPEPTPEPDCTIVGGFPAGAAGTLPSVETAEPIATVDLSVWADRAPDDASFAMLDGLVYGFENGILARIDPATGVTEALSLNVDLLPGEIVDVSAAGGGLWLTVEAGDDLTELVEIDTATGCEAQRVQVGAEVRQVQAVGQTLWVNEGDRLYEIDPTDGSIVFGDPDSNGLNVGNYEAMGVIGDRIYGVGFCGSGVSVDTNERSTSEFEWGDGDQCGERWGIGPELIIGTDSFGDPDDPAAGWYVEPASGVVIGTFELPFDIVMVAVDDAGGLALSETGEMWRLPAPVGGDVTLACLDGGDDEVFTDEPFELDPTVSLIATLDPAAFPNGLPGAFGTVVWNDILIAIDGSGLTLVRSDGVTFEIDIPWFTPDAISVAGEQLWLSGVIGNARRLVRIGSEGCPDRLVTTTEPAVAVVHADAGMWVQGVLGGLELDPITGATRRTFADAVGEASSISGDDLSTAFAEGHLLFAPTDDPILVGVGPCGEVAGLESELNESVTAALDRCDLDAGAVVGEWGFLLWGEGDTGTPFAVFDELAEFSHEGTVEATVVAAAATERGAWLITAEGGLWYLAVGT